MTIVSLCLFICGLTFGSSAVRAESSSLVTLETSDKGSVALSDPRDLRTWTVVGEGAVEGTSTDSIGVTYVSPKQLALVLRPPRPIVLSDKVESLSCWFARRAGDFTLAFQVQDSNGKVHELPVRTSRPTGGAVSWKKKKYLEWSLWTQAVSWSLAPNAVTEVESRVLPEFLDATKKLIWPRPLSIVGLKIQPAAHAAWDAPSSGEDVKHGKGALWLTQLQIKEKNAFAADWSWIFPARLRSGYDESPTLFPDDLTELNGKVEYSVEVRKGYQGPVIWHEQGVKSINRANPAQLYADRIVLPRLPAGRYFINSRTWKPDGALDAERLMLELIVVQQKQKVALESSMPDLSLESGQKSNVFPSDTEEASITLKVASSALSTNKESKLWHVKVIDYNSELVMERDVADLGGFSMKCPVRAGMEYFASAELKDTANVYNRAHLHFGVANAPEDLHKQKDSPPPPTRDKYLNGQVHLNAEFWIGSRSDNYPWVNGVDPKSFDRWLQQAVQAGVSVIAVGDAWGNHEMLPGVFQWSEVDREIEAARRYGLKVILAYSADGVAIARCFPFPLWIDAELQRDQSGNAPFLNFHPSYWDANIRNGWKNYYQKLASHVASSPDVVGYRLDNYALTGKPGSWGVNPFRIDYSEAAQKAFSVWLSDSKKPSIPMGKLFYIPGIPESELPGLDSSTGFREFVNFNTYTSQTRLEDLFAAIRSQDHVRQIQVDQKPFPYAIEAAIPTLKDGGVLKNEDSPTFNAAALRSMAIQAGVSYVEELHNHMPTSRSIADSVNFWSSYLSKGVFWLLRWHPDMISKMPLVLPKGDGSQRTEEAMLDYVKATQPHWQEWIKAVGAEPKILVFGSRAQGLLGNSRAGQEYGIGGIETFNALCSSHQVPCHFADEYADWVDLAKFDLVFACGEIVTEHGMDRLENYARKGGKLVLVGPVGKYCPDKLIERDLLQKRLAGLSNVKKIETPKRFDSQGKQDWSSPYSFNSSQLDPLLSWASFRRDVEVISDPASGFECQRRNSGDGNTVYVGVMRRWRGSYLGNIERDTDLTAKYGKLGGKVIVSKLSPGDWKVEQFHRGSKDIGRIKTSDGNLSFEVDPALAGEVQLYRCKRVTSN